MQKDATSIAKTSSLMQRRRSRNSSSSVTFSDQNLILEIQTQQPSQFTDPSLPRVEVDDPDAIAAGEELFENFVLDEIRVSPHIQQRERREQLRMEAERAMPVSPQLINQRQEWQQAGLQLRELADAFRDTRERREVRNQADRVPIESISAEDFTALLRNLFANGVNRECIVVLFYFCSDVAIRTLVNSGRDLFTQFISWSLSFIKSHVIVWVVQHGGWLRVLGNQVAKVISSLVVSVSLALIGVAVFRIIWK